MAIIISDKMYVGFSKRGPKDDPCLLGFATYLPIDDSKKQQTAFDKRKSTVDSWSTDWRSKKSPIAPKIMDNELFDGFKMAREVHRNGWGGGNVVWRIEDPRGFELEISSANMASIMSCSTLIEGVIQGKCKWGWNTIGGSRVVLLPETSEPYQEGLRDTSLRQQADIPIKDVNVGDHVSLKNGTEGTYMGLFHYVEAAYSNGLGLYDNGYCWKPSKRKTHFFITEDEAIYVMASPKVATITKKTLMSFTEQEGADLVNLELRTGTSTGSAGTHKSYVFVSPNPITEDQYHIELVPTDEVNTARSRAGVMTMIERDDVLARLHSHYGTNSTLEFTEIKKRPLLNEQLFVYVTKQAGQTYGFSRRSYERNVTFELERDQLDTYSISKMMVAFDGNLYPPQIY